MTITAISTPTLIAASAEPERARYRARSRSASRVAIGARRPMRAVSDRKKGASKIRPGMRRTIPKTSSGVPPLPFPWFVPPA
jgi:hypothetical protein